nr:hypothetical protein [Tanacetum cinerariifolium]
MNYLEEKMDGEAMINSIQNDDQPLPVIAQVQMCGSEYGEQDRKAAILYEYETFKAIEGDQFLDTYLRSGADDFSELKKITTLLAKAFNRRNFYSKPTNNNLRTSSTSQSANKKQEFVKSDNKKVEKKDDEKKRDMSKVKCYDYKKEGHFAKDCKKAKVLSDSDESSSSVEETIAEKRIEKVNQQSKDLENQSKDLQEKYDVLIIQVNTFEEQNNEFNEQMKDTLMFLIHSDEALEIEKFKRAKENKIEFAYDYGNLNASYVNEKIKFSDDYFQEIINLDFKKIDSPFQQTSSLKPYVQTVILEKIIIDLEDEVVSLLEKEKANLKIIESLKSKDLDTFSSVRRPKHSSVIWKKKGSSNTSNIDLSSVSLSKLNKDVKRYSHKDLLACNNSHLGEISSAFVCSDAMNVSCNS